MCSLRSFAAKIFPELPGSSLLRAGQRKGPRISQIGANSFWPAPSMARFNSLFQIQNSLLRRPGSRMTPSKLAILELGSILPANPVKALAPTPILVSPVLQPRASPPNPGGSPRNIAAKAVITRPRLAPVHRLSRDGTLSSQSVFRIPGLTPSQPRPSPPNPGRSPRNIGANAVATRPGLAPVRRLSGGHAVRDHGL